MSFEDEETAFEETLNIADLNELSDDNTEAAGGAGEGVVADGVQPTAAYTPQSNVGLTSCSVSAVPQHPTPHRRQELSFDNESDTGTGGDAEEGNPEMSDSAMPDDTGLGDDFELPAEASKKKKTFRPKLTFDTFAGAAEEQPLGEDQEMYKDDTTGTDTTTQPDKDLLWDFFVDELSQFDSLESRYAAALADKERSAQYVRRHRGPTIRTGGYVVLTDVEKRSIRTKHLDKFLKLYRGWSQSVHPVGLSLLDFGRRMNVLTQSQQFQRYRSRLIKRYKLEGPVRKPPKAAGSSDTVPAGIDTGVPILTKEQQSAIDVRREAAAARKAQLLQQTATGGVPVSVTGVPVSATGVPTDVEKEKIDAARRRAAALRAARLLAAG